MKKSELFFYDFPLDFIELESFFRDHHLAHPELHLDTPSTLEEVRGTLENAGQLCGDLLPKILIDDLDEDQFFRQELDVAIYQHIRYLPVFTHQHSFFEIACVISGSCTNYIAETTLKLTAGDVCVIAPNTRHALSVFSDDCIIWNILLRTSTFQRAFLGVLAEHDILSDFFARTLYQPEEMPYLLFTMEPDPDVYNFIGHLSEEIHRYRRYQERMVNSILNALFIILLRNHEKDIIIPSFDRSVMDENLIFILRYMQENCTTITLKHLAGFFNYSERQLQRIIKSATGRSFSENILKLRMEHAADLLVRQQMPVAEAADILGYYDASSFRHAFKDYYHMTPTQFKESHPI